MILLGIMLIWGPSFVVWSLTVPFEARAIARASNGTGGLQTTQRGTHNEHNAQTKSCYYYYYYFSNYSISLALDLPVILLVYPYIWCGYRIYFLLITLSYIKLIIDTVCSLQLESVDNYLKLVIKSNTSLIKNHTYFMNWCYF
jgi:hypothetical protein